MHTYTNIYTGSLEPLHLDTPRYRHKNKTPARIDKAALEHTWRHGGASPMAKLYTVGGGPSYPTLRPIWVTRAIVTCYNFVVAADNCSAPWISTRPPKAQGRQNYLRTLFGRPRSETDYPEPSKCPHAHNEPAGYGLSLWRPSFCAPTPWVCWVRRWLPAPLTERRRIDGSTPAGAPPPYRHRRSTHPPTQR